MRAEKNPGSDLAAILTRDRLIEMADERSFSRGTAYATEERVHQLLTSHDSVSATVSGTERYRVSLWAEGPELEYSCTCPWAAEGNFCKHCVAVGLVWLTRRGNEPTSGGPDGGKSGRQAMTLDDVRSMLMAEDKDYLVKLVMEQVQADERLGDRLLMRAAMRSDAGPRVATLRKVLSDAFRVGEFLNWRQVTDYAQGIHQVLNTTEQLVDTGKATAAIELAELGLRKCENAMGRVDDSDGEVGEISRRLQELHLEACRRARPDPEELAEKLFNWEMKSDWEVFGGSAGTYADLLGSKGLAVYRRLAESAWAKVRQVGPGEDSRFSSDRYAITSIMETLAELSGDLEELVAVKSRDLSLAYHFLQIAELYQKAHRPEPALEWAERGLKAFPDRTDSRLRAFLAERYHRLKRHEEALALVWAEFAENQDLGTYQWLKEHADRVKQWPAWRVKALEHMRSGLSAVGQERADGRWSPRALRDHSELVRAFLWENDVETAWTEARAGGCSEGLWMELAEKREKRHPQDSIEVYQRSIESSIEDKTNRGYEDAVKLMKRVGRLMLELGQADGFRAYVAGVRSRHKPKRNLLRLIDSVKWP